VVYTANAVQNWKQALNQLLSLLFGERLGFLIGSVTQNCLQTPSGLAILAK
jgi:hypothetical protein